MNLHLTHQLSSSLQAVSARHDTMLSCCMQAEQRKQMMSSQRKLHKQLSGMA